MAEKFAIYFGEPLATATAGYEQSRSARVNQLTQEWLQLVADNVPALAAPEWEALAACTSGTDLGDESTLKFLWAAVADSPPVCASFGVDAEELSAKIRALPLAGRYALREALARLSLAADAGEGMPAAAKRLALAPRGG